MFKKYSVSFYYERLCRKINSSQFPEMKWEVKATSVKWIEDKEINVSVRNAIVPLRESEITENINMYIKDF